MFEKETEQYVDNNFYDLIEEVLKLAKVTFEDGAEFGYNKAMNERGYRIESAYREGVAFGKDKANEWHYPSKGEYPKDEKKVLVQLKDVEEPILDYYRQDGLWNYALEDEIIAWKEIILPKE